MWRIRRHGRAVQFRLSRRPYPVNRRNRNRRTTDETLTTCLTAAVLAFSAGTALARDVGPDEVARLLQAGTIQPLEKFNEAALAKHPGFRVDETDLDEEHGRFIYQVELRETGSAVGYGVRRRHW